MDSRGGAGLWAHWGNHLNLRVLCVFQEKLLIKSVIGCVNLEPRRKESTGNLEHGDGK